MMSVGAASLTPTPTLPHLLRRWPAHSLNPPLLSGSRASPLSSRPQRRHALPLSASRRRRGRQSGEDNEDGGGDDWWPPAAEEEEEDDEAATPLREMRQWIRNKPTGFGEGTTYDTRLEDQLWEEMERNRKAQLANLNKLKNESKKSDAGTEKKQEPPRKATDEVPCGARVRIWNLPRKKNIHRDLQRAFKGFPGLISISPAVIGNQKTRDPICKGFAFVDLASQAAANRFVQVYSRRSLQFGKVEKQIACHVINLRGTFNSSEPQDGDTLKITLLKSIKAGDEMHTTSDIEILSQDPQEMTFDDGFVGIKVIDEFEVEPMSPKRKIDGPSTPFEERENDQEHYNISFSDNVENGSEVLIKNSGPNDSVPPMRKQQKRTSSNKKAVKTDGAKDSKPSLPGSVARLKNKERTVLTSVFSKYSTKDDAES